MSIIKYKNPNSNEWIPLPMVKIVNTTRDLSAIGVPTDIVKEADRVISSIQSKRASNSLNFIAVSDMHELSDNDAPTKTEQYRRANLNAGQGIRLVAEQFKPDFFVNLGDLAWGANSSTQGDLIQSLVNAKGYTANTQYLTECFFTPGNHDVYYLQNTYFPSEVVKGIFGTYRYVDFPSKKIRVICLNTADTLSGNISYEHISGTQLQWFANSLDLSTKSDASDWGIVVLSHHPMDWSDGNATQTAIVKCLKAYLEGTTYSATQDGINISYNYNGKNAATFIANFHGHTHCFKVANISGTEALRIAIPNACFERTNEYGEGGNLVFGEDVSYEKVDNSTGQNTSFCVVSVDLDNKIIHADCFGAGTDRTIPYSSNKITTYKITNVLIGTSNSNGARVIAKDASYYAIITVESGYLLDSIKVTMGGVDITSTAVSGNSITIPKVTGDIIINAQATAIEVPEEPGVYVNLVPTAIADSSGAIYNAPYGYMNGKYVSTSAINAFGSDEACVATGSILLPATANAIYIKGAAWNTSNSHARFASGSEVGGVSYVCHADGSGANQLSQFFTTEILGENYYKWTLTNDGQTHLRGKYYRLSLVGTGENLIITHDQPITNGSSDGEIVTTYTITNNLTNVTSSNPATSINSSSDYAAILTPKSGYTLTGGTVSVIMGDTDITSSTYSNGNISISNVTGNIIITATAVAQQATPSYTNLVPTALDLSDPSSGAIFNASNTPGYMNGQYISTASPYYNTDSTTVTTGFIPYTATTQKPIYIKGVTYKTGSHDRLGYHDTNYIGVRSTLKFSETSFTDCFTVTQLGTDYFKFTPTSTATIETKLPRMAYVAFSFTGVGENLIITIDEPIE